MIGYLEGVLIEKTPTKVLINVSGVGYELAIPISTYYALPAEGQAIALRVHTHVREDALLLFGFLTPLEREFFELLLRTSGVGPKLAQAILSGGPPLTILAAICEGDEKILRAIPGVGTKTAQRIIVDLRESAAALLERASEGGTRTPPSARNASSSLEGQAVSALLNLGYSRAVAERVVVETTKDLDAVSCTLEAVLRGALRRLMK